MQGEISTDALTGGSARKAMDSRCLKRFADAGDEPAATLCRIRIVRRQDRLTYQTVRMGARKDKSRCHRSIDAFVRVR
jgi:hypothetical protein